MTVAAPEGVLPAVARLVSTVRTVYRGPAVVVEHAVVCLLSRGHLLIEDVPGVGKTTLAMALGKALGLGVHRLQFTPDTLPSDILGLTIFNQQTQAFDFHPGPVFTPILVADEINRATPKTQAALLEAMNERSVTVDGETRPLPEPFLVLATQNPIEQEGTYPLPEAQVDRFLMKLKVGYPTKAEERQILDRMGDATEAAASASVRPVLAPDRIVALQQLVRELYADERIKGYLVELVAATRDPKAYGLPELADFVQYGASPRATLALLSTARAHAFLQGRGYVVPEDVKEVAPDVLRHRVLLSYEAEAENVSSDQVVSRILERIEVP